MTLSPVLRLFSTFAHGAPGAGLLIMRVAAGSALVVRAVEALAAGAPPLALAFNAVSTVTGVLLFIGFLTPIAGVLVAVVAALHAFVDPGSGSFYVMLGVLGVGLALLGPGAWSLDARLFGWKRVEIRNGKSSGSGKAP